MGLLLLSPSSCIARRDEGRFLEYTAVEAAGAALREMNGKIINGWMIVVDVAKTSPPRHIRGRQMQLVQLRWAAPLK